MNKNDILALFKQWNDAIKTKKAKNVVALYDESAILLPTISNQVRFNHEEIEDYFDNFLAMVPVGHIDESNVRIFDQIAINSGIYTFTFKGGNKVKARYTFVYRWNGLRWMIIEHHSSQMPEVNTTSN
jgi:uncharacterized protein (TIGR02246 family)